MTPERALHGRPRSLRAASCVRSVKTWFRAPAYVVSPQQQSAKQVVPAREPAAAESGSRPAAWHGGGNDVAKERSSPPQARRRNVLACVLSKPTTNSRSQRDACTRDEMPFLSWRPVPRRLGQAPREECRMRRQAARHFRQPAHWGCLLRCCAARAIRPHRSRLAADPPRKSAARFAPSATVSSASCCRCGQ